ncbi:MAG TPA: hypothetical protein VFI27_00435 [candidate division Zixibacteria bacterium]|nr:hypothetical protein [candidate division Zixibacteria bacterium]
MNDTYYSRWLAYSLSAALAVSFVLCVASDLSFSATLDKADLVLPATTGIIALGISWLVGHGLHGAAVIAVPFFFVTSGKAGADKKGIEPH